MLCVRLLLISSLDIYRYNGLRSAASFLVDGGLGPAAVDVIPLQGLGTTYRPLVHTAADPVFAWFWNTNIGCVFGYLLVQ